MWSFRNSPKKHNRWSIWLACYILKILNSPKFKREENDVKHTSELIRRSSESDLFNASVDLVYNEWFRMIHLQSDWTEKFKREVARICSWIRHSSESNLLIQSIWFTVNESEWFIYNRIELFNSLIYKESDIFLNLIFSVNQLMSKE